MRRIGASSSTTRIAASAMCPSCRHECEIRFERGEVEAVRRLATIEKVVRDDAVALVDVAVPEAPRHSSHLSPRHHGETVCVVADDVDRMPAPRPGPRVPGERAGPVPDLLRLRGERQLDSDVEAAEEPGGRPHECVLVYRHPRVRADAMPPDSRL